MAPHLIRAAALVVVAAAVVEPAAAVPFDYALTGTVVQSELPNFTVGSSRTVVLTLDPTNPSMPQGGPTPTGSTFYITGLGVAFPGEPPVTPGTTSLVVYRDEAAIHQPPILFGEQTNFGVPVTGFEAAATFAGFGLSSGIFEVSLLSTNPALFNSTAFPENLPPQDAFDFRAEYRLIAFGLDGPPHEVLVVSAGTPAAVPEPPAGAVFGLAVGALALLRRAGRRRVD